MKRLEIHETIAMEEGDQHVTQCAWCGLVAIYPGSKRDLGACPLCGRGVWWPQTFPVAGARP